MYEWYNGVFDKKLYVCHTCDIPYCVNPKHLFLGSQKDNMIDMARKNRSTHGSKSARAILNERLVEEILILANNNEFTSIKHISEKYQVKRSSIGKILNGKI